MKKLSLIVCILSLFSFTTAFASDTDSPSGADLCAADREIVDKAEAVIKTKEGTSTKSTKK